MLLGDIMTQEECVRPAHTSHSTPGPRSLTQFPLNANLQRIEMQGWVPCKLGADFRKIAEQGMAGMSSDTPNLEVLTPWVRGAGAPVIIPLAIMLIVLAILPLLLSGEFLLLEPDVWGSLLAFVASGLLTRLIDDQDNRHSFFRYDQAVSIAVTLTGFAALNLLRGNTVSELFPPSFEFAAQSRIIHAVAIGLAIVIGLMASLAFTRLANNPTLKETGWKKWIPRRHGITSYAVFIISAAAFTWYMSVSLNQVTDRSLYSFILVLAGCSSGGLWVNEVIRRKMEAREPHILLRGNRTAFPLAVNFYPDRPGLVIKEKTSLPTGWKNSSGIISPVFETQQKQKKGKGSSHLLSFSQGSRPFVSYQENLLTLRVTTDGNPDESALKVRLKVEKSGDLHGDAISSAQPPYPIETQHVMLPYSRDRLGRLTDYARIFTRHVAGYFEKNSDRELRKDLRERKKWFDQAIPALDAWLEREDETSFLPFTAGSKGTTKWPDNFW